MADIATKDERKAVAATFRELASGDAFGDAFWLTEERIARFNQIADEIEQGTEVGLVHYNRHVAGLKAIEEATPEVRPAAGPNP